MAEYSSSRALYLSASGFSDGDVNFTPSLRVSRVVKVAALVRSAFSSFRVILYQNVDDETVSYHHLLT